VTVRLVYGAGASRARPRAGRAVTGLGTGLAWVGRGPISRSFAGVKSRYSVA
jgi:hypothetical protein